MVLFQVSTRLPLPVLVLAEPRAAAAAQHGGRGGGRGVRRAGGGRGAAGGGVLHRDELLEVGAGKGVREPLVLPCVMKCVQ